jgi:hypothetical protein
MYITPSFDTYFFLEVTKLGLGNQSAILAGSFLSAVAGNAGEGGFFAKPVRLRRISFVGTKEMKINAYQFGVRICRF